MVKNHLVLTVALIVFAPLLLHGADYRFVGDDADQTSFSSRSSRQSSYRPKNWIPSQNGKPIGHSHLVDLVTDDYPDHFMPGANKVLKNSPHGPEILDAYRSAYEEGNSGHLRSLMTGEHVARSSSAPSPEFVKSIFSQPFKDQILGATASQRSSTTDSLYKSQHSSSTGSLSDFGMNYFNDERPEGSFLDKRKANAPLVPPSGY